MPNRTTYEEALALSRQLAPLLATIPRRTVNPRSLPKKDPAGPAQTPYGGARILAEVILEHEPAAPAARITLVARQFGLRPATLCTVTAERRRALADPAVRAREARLTQAAEYFFQKHPESTSAQRTRFAQAHHLHPVEFRHALARARLLPAIRARYASLQKRAA